jgi:hypothetical protein
MAKKMLYGIFLIVVLGLTFSVWYFANYQKQTPNSSPTPTPIVEIAKIVSVSPDDHWGNPVGMALASWIYISIRNEGVNEINGLTLNFTISGVSPEIYIWDTTAPIGTIRPNEIIEVQLYITLIHNGYENIGSVAGQNATIELLLEDKMLDKSQLTLPTM